MIDARLTSMLFVGIALCGCAQSEGGAVTPRTMPSDSRSSDASAPDRIELVGALKRTVESSSAARDEKICSAWTYDAENLAHDLAAFKEVDQQTWGKECYQYACSYVAPGRLEGKGVNITVNAGGWISASAGGTTRYFASAAHNERFLDACNCCE